ncbi:MAG: hypothetical protein P4M11_03505 [Candidatus Pacebacteria bacterium]|nr:hypothetical protein [Candidatus Paceibacterota bacterium]
MIRITEPYFLDFLKIHLARKLCLCVGREDKSIKKAEENLEKNNIIAGFMLSALGVEVSSSAITLE